MNIIGFAGKAQSGKTTAAMALVPYGFAIVPFAGELKKEVERFLMECMVPFEPRHLYGTGKDKEERLKIQLNLITEQIYNDVGVPCDWPLNGCAYFTTRELMQWWGVMRRQRDPDYWANKVMNRCRSLLDRGLARGIAIDDVRFPNEYNAICAHEGVVFRVIRVNQTELAIGGDHISETALDDWTMPPVINNGENLDDFHNSVLYRVMHEYGKNL